MPKNSFFARRKSNLVNAAAAKPIISQCESTLLNTENRTIKPPTARMFFKAWFKELSKSLADS